MGKHECLTDLHRNCIETNKSFSHEAGISC